jgi:hypothetical protein
VVLVVKLIYGTGMGNDVMICIFEMADFLQIRSETIEKVQFSHFYEIRT